MNDAQRIAQRLARQLPDTLRDIRPYGAIDRLMQQLREIADRTARAE